MSGSGWNTPAAGAGLTIVRSLKGLDIPRRSNMRIVSWLAAAAAALAFGCASSNTPSTPATARPATAAAPSATANGTIQQYTSSANGQPNGFVLASGQKVQLPESMGAQLSDQFPPNTAVTVVGHMVTDADGRSVLQADKISAPDRNASVDLTAAAPPSSPGSVPAVGGSGTGTGGSQPLNPPTQSTTPPTQSTPDIPPSGK